jgi:hypothetical protein
MPTIFGDKLAERLRTYSLTQEANYNCNRWVSVRVDFITSLVSLLAGIIAVSKAGVLAAGLVGFSLMNATGLSETILVLVRSMNELEVQLQSASHLCLTYYKHRKTNNPTSSTESKSTSN